MKKLLLILIVMILATSGTLLANTIVFDLDTEFSGATPPEGTAPWLRATFDDNNTPGTVELTLDALNLVDHEFIGSWYFNFDPALNAADLISGFNAVDISAISGGSISFGNDSFKADGDGFYDIVFNFFNNDFTAGEAIVVEFSMAGITANSFDFLSVNSDQHFPTAAHVQGIGANDDFSGWITGGPSGGPTPIPEPTSLLLFGTGLGALGLGSFLRKKK